MATPTNAPPGGAMLKAAVEEYERAKASGATFRFGRFQPDEVERQFVLLAIGPKYENRHGRRVAPLLTWWPTTGQLEQIDIGEAVHSHLLGALPRGVVPPCAMSVRCGMSRSDSGREFRAYTFRAVS